MDDFSWDNITWIRPGEGYILAMVIVAHLVMVFLIDQKKFPRVGLSVAVLAAWLMVCAGYVFVPLLFMTVYSVRTLPSELPSVVTCSGLELMLAMGLIYANRGRQTDDEKFSGCFLRMLSLTATFILACMMLIQILAAM